MKKVLRSLLFIQGLIFMAAIASAQQSFFSDVSESSIMLKGKRTIFPQKFRTTKADFDGLRNFLLSLPAEANILNRNLTPEILLPKPDGQMARFHVWESSIQEPALQAKFPEIRTFCGQGIDDPRATIRLDINPYFGFHGQILTPEGNYYIDPYSRNDVDHYMSYFTTDHIKPHDFVCYTNEPSLPRPDGVEAGPCRGTTLKTYRLAIACTGEYAVAVGGTTAGALHAAIVTSANRVSGVYETEISVRLILVSNNNVIEYMSASTDPFTGNSNANTLINESQTVITANIGSANYDFGHTFSTGGGGLAQLGCVCSSNNKARGITGSPQPTGDDYDIDYVAHEMGHQLGGNHTFNSNLSSCSGNRASSAAYEVGAGTTIMGYAGICGADDTQPHSDPVFHAISFDEISSYINSGGTCGTNTPTGNTLPAITAMDNMGANIPLNTPFTLTGTATDADGDALSYCWEEWDLGTSTTWAAGANNSTSPIFKSRLPKTIGSRTFPDIAVILANYPTNPTSTMGGLKGETLPKVARTMKFRLTIRDNRAGGGGVVSGGAGCQTGYTANFPINAITGTGPFIVTYPDASGLSFPGGSSVTVTWNVAGTNVAPINTAKVKIMFSSNGGQNFNTVLLDSTDNDGSEAVILPVGATTTARIKVMAVGNVYFDISNNNFSITQAASDFSFNNANTSVTFPCATINSPVITLGTGATGGFNTPINLTASGNPAGTTVSLSSTTINPGGSVDVQLLNTGSLTFGTYTITITGVAGPSTHTIDLTFQITSSGGPSIVAQPVNAEICEGSNTSFSVSSPSATGVKWQVSTNNGNTWSDLTNGGVYSGVTTETLSISAATIGLNGYFYRAITSITCGSTTSGGASLAVKAGTRITGQPQSGAICIGNNKTFTVNAAGTNISYQWQSSTDCTNFSDIIGATSANYTVNNTTGSMNNNCYRVVVDGECQTAPVNSNNAVLTVNNLPTVTITASGSTEITPGSSIILTASSNPQGTSFLWYKNNVIIPGFTSNTYRVTYTTQADLGAYKAEVTDVNTCRNQSDPVNITAGISTLISPNPTAVGYFNLVVPTPAVAATIMMYDSKGALVYKNTNPGNNPIKIRTGNLSSGIYMVEILDNKAQKIAIGRVIVTHK